MRKRRSSGPAKPNPVTVNLSRSTNKLCEAYTKTFKTTFTELVKKAVQEQLIADQIIPEDTCPDRVQIPRTMERTEKATLALLDSTDLMLSMFFVFTYYYFLDVARRPDPVDNLPIKKADLLYSNFNMALRKSVQNGGGMPYVLSIVSVALSKIRPPEVPDA
jgi:hypothetical protein